MSVDPLAPSQTHPLQLALIDDDPIYRSGLRLWLEQFSDLAIALEASSANEALQHLRDLGTTESPTQVDLVILEMGLGRSDPSQLNGLALCQRLRATNPSLAILLIGTSHEPVVIAAAQQAGASGYCAKDAAPRKLLTIIRRVSTGTAYWDNASIARSPGGSNAEPGPFSNVRRTLRLSGLAQIEQAIAEITAQLHTFNLSALDRMVLAGRRRELMAARWLVQQLLSTPALPDPTGLESLRTTPLSPRPAGKSSLPTPHQSGASAATASIVSSSTQEPSALAPTAALEGALAHRSLRPLLFDAVLANIESGANNLTNCVLETDILRQDKKRELFYLILRQLEHLLDELRFSGIQPPYLVERRSQLLTDLWQATTTNFFGKYATVLVRGGEIDVVPVLLGDAAIVQTEILNKIPGFTDLLLHLLFQTPLVIDSVPYAAGNPEAVVRAEALLSHLVIQVANAVMQPLLNRFADVEPIKQAFYDRALLSSRDIERFRNNLSWRYRVDRLVTEPKAIFESQYHLFTFQPYGIKVLSVYAPRRDELEQLSGLPFLVTLALETRDAIAPRLRAAVSVIGSGLVYVLTEVIGRGIGLVGRGVLKGVGQVWQEGRYHRNSERP